MDELRFLTRYISVAYRQGNRFYDRELSRFGIGCGQQLFLLRVHENEGITMYDLARLGHFDKGTVTKAVQKLEEQGFLRVQIDSADRRIRRLYTTQQALPVIETVYSLRRRWHAILTEGMDPEEAERVHALLGKMAENAFHYMNEPWCSPPSTSNTTEKGD